MNPLAQALVQREGCCLSCNKPKKDKRSLRCRSCAISINNKGRQAWNKGLKTGLIPKTAYKKNDPRITGIDSWNKGCFGANSHSWKGGESISSQGYITVCVSRSNKRYLKHRFVIEQKLGRKLLQKEQVHHINGNKKDNRIENLMLIDIAEHTKLHARERREYI